MSEDTKNKVLFIGLDGATFDLLNPWASQGKMPNIARIMERGVTGELKSTIPPITGPAWVSFRTGTNPGKHDIFSFLAPPSPTIDSISIINSTWIDGEAFWTKLSKEGKVVGVVDMPLTYPVEELNNGFTVSRIITGGRKYSATYPESLKQRLLSDINISFDWRLVDGLSQTPKYLKHLIGSIVNKEKIDTYLLENFDWDCFVTVYSAIDVFQHHFWKYVDDKHPKYNSKLAKKFLGLIDEFIGKLDEAIANTIRYADENTVIFIVSDHGFGPLDKLFYVNTWLAQAGFLSFKKEAGKRVKNSLLEKGWNSKKVLELLLRLDIFKLREKTTHDFRKRVREILWKNLTPTIDLSKTKAYFRSNTEMGIYINAEDRWNTGIVTRSEYEVLREELIDKILSIIDLETGEPVVRKAFKREDVYFGGHVSDAPDIILEMNELYASSNEFSSQIIKEQSSEFINGSHRDNGIFIVMGKNIKEGQFIRGAEIVDIAPTILYIMDSSIPEEMDGKVLQDIFKSPYAYDTGRPQQTTAIHNAREPRNVYSKEEEKKIAERLSKLGYLD